MDGMTHAEVLSDELAAPLRRALEADYEHAFAMPGAFYLSEDLLAIERAQLFGREWICVGRADEIPEPGDFMTYDILGEPVVAIRGEDGAIRALSNVCRHRAMPILEGKGQGSGNIRDPAFRIQCFFIQACRLFGSPRLHEGFTPKEQKLKGSGRRAGAVVQPLKRL